jgi:hypothetical protein
MSTSTASAETQSAGKTLSAAFSIGAVLATVGSLGFISLNGLPPREAYVHPVSIVTCVLSAIGCLILAFALLRWRTTLPGWAVIASAAGMLSLRPTPTPREPS